MFALSRIISVLDVKLIIGSTGQTHGIHRDLLANPLSAHLPSSLAIYGSNGSYVLPHYSVNVTNSSATSLDDILLPAVFSVKVSIGLMFDIIQSFNVQLKCCFLIV